MSGNTKNRSNSNKYDINEIEKIIDKIILNHKEKIDKVHENGFDIDKIGLKNRNNNKIYYIKKKNKNQNNKDNKEGNSAKLSGKIISEARENLGEEPVKFPKVDDLTPSTNKKTKKESKESNWLKFEKKEKKIIQVDQVNKSKDLDKIVNHIEKISKIDINEENKEDAKILDEKILNSPSDKKIDNKKDKIEEKAIDLAKTHDIFTKKEKPEEDSKEQEFLVKNEENTPRFHVDNIPNNIDEEQNKFKIYDTNNKSENNKLQKNRNKNSEKDIYNSNDKHLKEKDFSEQNTPLFRNDKETEKTSKEANDEHVFFDEDNTFKGWSPQVIEKGDKQLPLSVRPETDISDFGEIKDLELPKDVLNLDSVKLSDLGFSEDEWEELDFYPLHEPFAYVEILREKESLEKCYFLVEIELTDEERHLLDFINETMYWLTISTEELEDKGDEQYLINSINQVISEYSLNVSEEAYNKILYYLGKSSLGLGKIDPLMKDPNIEDISCDGAGVPLFLYHRQYGSLKSNIRFNQEDDLSSFVFRLAQKCGKHISIAEPMLDATMPDGSRVQMTLSDEITTRGSTFTIRKFRADPFSPPDIVEFNTMSSDMVAYMWLAVENGINTLFAGGTASGKTTALNALSLFIPPQSKIVSIEETREINLPHPNWIPGVARAGFGEVVADKVIGEIDMYDLMKAALRQRPEYILVGEIRGREAYVLFQAMATGHATYSTVHADSAQSLIHRLEGKPINIPRVMLQSLDIVSLHVITRVKNKRARRCKQIIEIIDIDPTTKEILTNEVFRWDPVDDKFVYSGKSYVLERIRAEKDMSRESMTLELKNRQKIVEWMNSNNIRDFKEVSRIVSHYIENPDEALKLINKDVKH